MTFQVGYIAWSVSLHPVYEFVCRWECVYLYSCVWERLLRFLRSTRWKVQFEVFRSRCLSYFTLTLTFTAISVLYTMLSHIVSVKELCQAAVTPSITHNRLTCLQLPQPSFQPSLQPRQSLHLNLFFSQSPLPSPYQVPSPNLFRSAVVRLDLCF